MDGGAWWAAVHGVAKSRTRLSDFTSTFHFHALEKEMATQSSIHAWRTQGTGEPGGLLSMRSHRVGDDWSYLAAAVRINIPFFKSQWICYNATSALWSLVFWPPGMWECSSLSRGRTWTPCRGWRSFNAGRPGKPTTSVLMHIPRRPSQAESSKCGPSTSSRSTWELVHTSSAPSPDPLGWKVWKWGPVLHALTSPPGDYETSKVWELLL